MQSAHHPQGLVCEGLRFARFLAQTSSQEFTDIDFGGTTGRGKALGTVGSLRARAQGSSG